MLVVNSSWNILNFRSGLIRALIKEGYDVVAVAPDDNYTQLLSTLGCRFIPLEMDNKGMHPGRDLRLLFRLYRLMRQERPDVFLGFTIKPNIYGSLAAHALGIPVINNIAGLGITFLKTGYLNRLVRAMYRLALLRSRRVFFQNCDDRSLFISSGLVKATKTERLPGSGIDLDRFGVLPLPSGSPVRFLLVARMLWDKGVGEYVNAARILKRRGIDADCCLVGFLDVQNPSAISPLQMDQWVNEGVVRYLGASDDVRVEIAASNCIVLPSFYREGTPRSLLEAAAMGRPIITTDSVGCRDVVDDGLTGYICKPQNAESLADQMERFTALSPEMQAVMGERGRVKIEAEFDEKVVIRSYKDALNKIVCMPQPI
jgi:glycosyltransferase involved in cell wall biosynthesis